MNNIQKLLDDKNKPQIWLAVELGVSKETVNQYVKGTIKPRLDMLIKMSKVFNTSIDYIVGIVDNPVPNDLKLNNRENNLLNNYKKLDENEKQKVEGYIAGIMDAKIKNSTILPTENEKETTLNS